MLSTAVAAADAGVGVQVVADACAGVSDTSHAQALDILRLYGPLVEVVSLADVLRPDGEPGLPGSAEPSAGTPERPAS